MVRRPTLVDISEAAGVSTFTVSQALAGKSGVSSATRERVVDIAHELGYVPNTVAANLKAQTTNTVGVMTASGRNQYYSTLVQGIDRVLQQSGYHAVTNDAMRGSRYDAVLERQSVETFLQQRVAAIVATYSLSRESLSLIEKWEIPLLFVDALPPNVDKQYAFVGADNFAASEAVARYFGDLNVSRAAFVAYPSEWNTREPRERGFVETATSLGIHSDVIEAENSAESAFDAVLGYLDSLDREEYPQAIYASNIPLLQGALKAVRSLKLTVPGDISILGFDDFDWAELLDPPMTVVDQHIDLIGQTAGRQLLDLVTGTLTPSSDAWHVAIRPDVIIRMSCQRVE